MKESITVLATTTRVVVVDPLMDDKRPPCTGFSGRDDFIENLSDLDDFFM
jgi:hypothetical protein